MSRLRAWSAAVRREMSVVKLAAKDPRVPKSAKWLAGAAVTYAISPIDLIPDFIPVLGQLDDLLIVPGLAWLAMRQVDPAVIADLRAQAAARSNSQ